MIFIAQNIKYLRRKNSWTQQILSEKLEVKRALIGAYEEGRATPKIAVLQLLAKLANCSLDDFIGVDLSLEKELSSIQTKETQVLPIVVDEQNEELIPIVPVKASAGYLNGMADPEFIGNLPRFSMPVPELSREKTFRVFQIQGDSMLPVTPGSYIFAEFVENPADIKDGETYILITLDEGLVYKRVEKSGTKFILKSDNAEYSPYEVALSTVLEIWKAKGVLSFDVPKPRSGELQSITHLLKEMKDEIRQLRK